MFLKIIWESGEETLVDCARVRVAPVFEASPSPEHPDGIVTILFEAERDYRPQGFYYIPPKSAIQVFLMNEKGATIENWHQDRRVALAKGVSAPYGQPEPLTSPALPA